MAIAEHLIVLSEKLALVLAYQYLKCSYLTNLKTVRNYIPNRDISLDILPK